MEKFTQIVSFGLLTFFLVVGASSTVNATNFILTDQNSTVETETDMDFGMWDWQVDGVSHLYQQWFWYRTGSMEQEESIDMLPLIGEYATDTNPFVDNSDDTLSLRYGAADTFYLDVTYTLRGGAAGSNASDTAEIITITNNFGSTLDFSFFQFSDFDLSETAFDDSASMVNANTIQQWDPNLVVSETVVTPSPSHWQIDDSGLLYASLTDFDLTGLDDNNNLSLPGDDASWAFQWDFVIGSGNSVQISKDKNLAASIPDPSGLLLLCWSDRGDWRFKEEV